MSDEQLIDALASEADAHDAMGNPAGAAFFREAAARLAALTEAGGFRVGDRVEKVGTRSGYRGRVAGVVNKSDGLASLTVEVDPCDAVRGLLMTAVPEQLRRLP